MKLSRKIVKGSANEASELYVVIDVTDSLLLVGFKSCIHRGFIAEVNADEVLEEVVAFLDSHAYPILCIWRDKVDGIA